MDTRVGRETPTPLMKQQAGGTTLSDENGLLDTGVESKADKERRTHNGRQSTEAMCLESLIG